MNRVPTTESEAKAWLESLQRAWLEEDTCELVLRYAPSCDVRQDGEHGHGRELVRCAALRLRERHNYCHYFELWTLAHRRLVAVVHSEWWDESTGYWFRGQGLARFELNDAGAIEVHDITVDSVPIPLDDRKLA